VRSIAVVVGAAAISVVVLVSVVAWNKSEAEQRRHQEQAERDDRAHRARLELSRTLREKPIEQIVAEARARDQAAADQQRSLAEGRARETELRDMDSICRDAMRTQMAHLEPEDHRIPPANVEHGRTTLVYVVRLTKSFRAAPVGAVKCSLRSVAGPAILTHIRT
jgi:hypothetical protein